MLEKVQTEPSTSRNDEFPIFGSIRRFVTFDASQKLWPGLMQSYVSCLITSCDDSLGHSQSSKAIRTAWPPLNQPLSDHPDTRTVESDLAVLMTGV